MTKRRMFVLCSAAIAAIAMALTPAAGFSQSNAGKLAGSWSGTVVGTNPPGLPPFTDLITFTSDGSVIECRRLLAPESPFGPLMETAGHGAWERVEREFDVHFVFLLQGAASGADIGTDNIHLRLHLDSTGAVLSGTFDSTIKDTSGNPIFTASGTYQAAPI